MKRVLVVDDEAPIARLVSMALKLVEVEHTLDYCSDGAQGRAMAARGEHDLVVLDLAMPLMDGVAALEEMKKNPKSSDVPVIVFTAMRDPGLHERVSELGAAALVTKPCEVDKFGAILRMALSGESVSVRGKGPTLRPMGPD